MSLIKADPGPEPCGDAAAGGRDDGRGPVKAAKGADWRELRNVAALWRAVKAKAGESPPGSFAGKRVLDQAGEAIR
jgi:hypothetical protein